MSWFHWFLDEGQQQVETLEVLVEEGFQNPEFGLHPDSQVGVREFRRGISSSEESSPQWWELRQLPGPSKREDRKANPTARILRAESWRASDAMVHSKCRCGRIPSIYHGRIRRFISPNVGGNKYLVTELLGPNLQTLLDICGGKFQLKTTIMLMFQVVRHP